MTIQLSVTVQNAILDALEAAIGSSDNFLRILTGAAPANCAAAQTGTLLAEITLPSNWMANASANAKAMAGTWEDTSADATGTAGYFRIVNVDPDTGTTCHFQGSVTVTGGGGDMEVTSISFVAGQKFAVTEFTLTGPNS